MQAQKLHLKDFLFILPGSLILGAGLAALQAGAWWIGWLGFSALFVVGAAALVAAWRWAGAGRTLAWMIGLALLLRLASGVAVYLALPINGHNTSDDKAGFVFTDAHRRDDQAWQLASLGNSLWSAFDKTYYTDQYGGLLAFSAVTYRLLSPDAHRPLLILLLAALTAALGVPFLLQATRLLWNDGLALVAGWLFVLYPESILTGGAQMREPFLLTFIAMSWWGFADWLTHGKRHGWLWMAIGFVGMLMVSPGIALAALVIFAGWVYLRGEYKRIPWQASVTLAVIFVLALLVLSWSLNRSHDFGTGSPLGVILDWFRGAAKYDTYRLERGSGWIQALFRKMDPSQQLLFTISYGILQPVLPAAFIEPTTLTWKIIAILRALGWYAILPLLIYSAIAAWRTPRGVERRIWLWIVSVSWLWILICSMRGGGDQWDNPRYRLMLFGFQALAAGYAWVRWRAQRDAWLPRLAAVEALAVLIFLQWYISRYYHWGGQVPFFLMIGLIVLVSAAILGGGWLWDRRGASKSRLTRS
ncbi:MAG TPA: hypothetical protein VLZ89_09070 [Anaerolineales bacterium]|nr:hypothetical protein [Anaerolineales bacterium]